MRKDKMVKISQKPVLGEELGTVFVGEEIFLECGQERGVEGVVLKIADRVHNTRQIMQFMYLLNFTLSLSRLLTAANSFQFPFRSGCLVGGSGTNEEEPDIHGNGNAY